MKPAWDFWALFALLLAVATSVGIRRGWVAGVAVVGVVVAIFTVPLWAGAILDPWARVTIRRYCTKRGFTNVQISSHPNHYGVRAIRDGQPIYARCQFVFGILRWTGGPP